MADIIKFPSPLARARAASNSAYEREEEVREFLLPGHAGSNVLRLLNYLTEIESEIRHADGKRRYIDPDGWIIKRSLRTIWLDGKYGTDDISDVRDDIALAEKYGLLEVRRDTNPHAYRIMPKGRAFLNPLTEAPQPARLG